MMKTMLKVAENEEALRRFLRTIHIPEDQIKEQLKKFKIYQANIKI